MKYKTDPHIWLQRDTAMECSSFQINITHFRGRIAQTKPQTILCVCVYVLTGAMFTSERGS